MENLTLPTVDELIEHLLDIRTDLRKEFIHEDYTDESYIDVRLRSFEEDWYLYTGSSDYDQDHRGYWAVSGVGVNDTEEDMRINAIDLIDGVKEHANE